MRSNFNFSMVDENITMVSGDTLAFNVIIKDQNGDAVTVDGATFKASQYFENTTTLAISKSLGDGITQDGAVLTVRLAPSDTVNLGDTFLYYDMDITVNSDRFTLYRGMMQIERDVKTTV